MPSSPPSGLVAALVDLVLPRACAGCGVPSLALCHTCRAQLAAEVLSFGGPARWQPSPPPAGFPPCAVAAAYEGAMARLVKAHKDGGRHDLTELLAAVLTEAVQALAPQGPVVLVPVPSRRAAVRQRGRATVADLAAAVAAHAPDRIRVAAALSVSGRVRDQAGLAARQRAANLRGVMTARPQRLNHPSQVVLVDDVVTSGATLVEAARALRSVGVPVTGAATLCARRRHLSAGSGYAMN